MTDTLFDLTDRVALITGSSRGIGRAIARQMAARGAYVVVSSRNQQACEAVVSEITEAGGESIG
ncbi:MAG: SDR family NAD(P)-dependent oxidoreductase [Salinisphaera sp.]|jgi:NAD(P)-dependent dehydrogenase (short-subunit alcohol dehydrogenase family)|nr:SDR family NAD(P)-dependent oxidoreductase [Salinisphaera sp.]